MSASKHARVHPCLLDSKGRLEPYAARSGKRNGSRTPLAINRIGLKGPVDKGVTMGRMSTNRPRLSAAALAGTLLLAGCNGNAQGSTETTPATIPDTGATATATAAPTQEQIAAQVIDYYNQERRAVAENGELGEEVRAIATYSWIDKRNANLDRLEDGGRSYSLVEEMAVGHQVVTFNNTASEPDAWTIVLNLCVEGRKDYKDDKGNTILDPETLQRGAEMVTARYNGLEDVWALTDFENGDAEACGYESQTESDASTSTDESMSTTEGP